MKCLWIEKSYLLRTLSYAIHNVQGMKRPCPSCLGTQTLLLQVPPSLRPELCVTRTGGGSGPMTLRCRMKILSLCLKHSATN